MSLIQHPCTIYLPSRWCIFHLQIKNHYRVITPEEYDAAVQRDPMCSPLTATGDFRSGRQLLADTEADLTRTIASLAASREGRAELDAIAAAIEAITRSL
jgi:hypothetical protein